MGEISIKKIAPNLDPRGVDNESTRTFYAEEFKKLSKENSACVVSPSQHMEQQEMAATINLEDIPTDCLPIAILPSEIAAFEKFMMKPNVQDEQIWTTLGCFMHPSVAEALDNVGSVSASELEEHSKLKFLIRFFKEIQTIREDVEIAIMCSNKTSEKILINAIKGRSFKITRLQNRGFPNDAYGLVFCHSRRQVQQKERDIPNRGYTIDLVLLVEVPIDTNAYLPKLFKERPVRIIQLACVGSPEIRLYNVQELLRKHSRTLLPRTTLRGMPPLIYKQVFTRKNLYNLARVVSQWNSVVTETLLRWFVDGRETHYRFQAFDQNRRLLEYLESARNSGSNPSSLASSPRLSSGHSSSHTDSAKRAYSPDHMSSKYQERDIKRSRASSSPPRDSRLSQQRHADPRQSSMSRDPRIRLQQQQQEQMQSQREIQQAEQVRQLQREQQRQELEQQRQQEKQYIQHQREMHQQRQQLLELQREKRLQELELQQYRAQQKSMNSEKTQSVDDLRVGHPSNAERTIPHESAVHPSCTQPSNPVQTMEDTSVEVDLEQIEEDPEPIVPERVRANLLGEETDYEEIVKNAIRQFELNLQRL
ncbi:hypothetical protein RMATCC62417_17652 [Rhizopus microsporus]|nr:hypothetical protein RMATCC62417_17652 [Rhizopus microsporus]